MAQPYKVPKLGQKTNHTCWFASAQMLYAWKHNDDDGLLNNADRAAAKKIIAADTPLDVSRIHTFRKLVGLRYTELNPEVMFPDGFIQLLDRVKSPIWYAGENQGFCDSPDFGHVVVITGIEKAKDKATVLFNDPWPPTKGMRRRMEFGEFFQKLAVPTDEGWPALFIR